MRILPAVFLCALCCEALAAPDCAKLYSERLATDLALSYQAFDQTQGQGFRVLAEQGCDKEAADLIEAYVRANKAEQRSLRWHIAQLRASEGATAEALRYAKSSLAESEDFSKRPLRWNDYVLATIAFLEKDKAKLVLHRDRVAAARADHHGNEMNLKLLDALIRHFDKDYKYATTHIEDAMACVAPTPEAVAEWVYAHDAGLVPPGTEMRSALSADLLELLRVEKECVEKTQEVCALDSNVWINAQDGQAHDPVFVRTAATATAATVEMRFTFALHEDKRDAKPATTQVVLTRATAEQCWTVDDIVGPRGVSLRQSLRINLERKEP